MRSAKTIHAKPMAASATMKATTTRSMSQQLPQVELA
jgi:hypothetical protein